MHGIENTFCINSEEINGKNGFAKNRLITNVIHALKQIMVKADKHKVEIEIMFIDFKQAFDSINREKWINAIKEFEIDNKLLRYIRMSIKHTKNNNKSKQKTNEKIYNK